MIKSSNEQINTVITNIENSIDYFINQHTADLNGAARIRNDALVVKALFEYRTSLLDLQKNNAPAKKRGNPNFGKNNPYTIKQEVSNDG
ncbi:hypothetical protein N9Z55_06575 [Akkermansiaceae bacterium]|jgi:hypothetical protein|nr:hypothetical protein [Akkermansiaceae bacterium]